MIYKLLGPPLLRLAVNYARRRYSTQIRVGAGIAATVAGIAVYWASRNVPEG